MIQFYCPDIETNPVLPESDSQHCVKVLRMAAGDELQIVDGRGGCFTCRLVDPHHKRALVEIVSRRTVAKTWSGRITVGVAPTKHLDRMEWLTEKLTEVGVDAIVPLLCERSERRELKTPRLGKIAVSAMKQSLKATLPAISEMTPFHRALEEAVARGDTIYMAHCVAGEPRRLLAREAQPGAAATLLIGPEGDFSPAEIEAALAAGAVPVSLGDSRLRTETAALVGAVTLHVVSQINEQ